MNAMRLAAKYQLRLMAIGVEDGELLNYF